MNRVAAPSTRFTRPESHPEVTVIVVTYNNRGQIDALIESLRAEAAQLTIAVIVADNQSEDGTLEYLSQRHPDVTLVATGGNLGYAAAINIAVKRVDATDAVLILNPDTVVEPHAIVRLLSALEDPQCGAVVPRIQNEDGTLYHSLRREPTLLTALGDALLGARIRSRPGLLSETVFESDAYAHAHEIDWATGAAIMIRPSVARRVGDWDEGYFLYSEETDYCRRVREAGYEIRFEPSAIVTHAQGASGVSTRLNALSAVNRIRYARKFHSGTFAAPFRAIAVLAEILRLRKPENAGTLAFVIDESKWSQLPQADPPRKPVFGYLVPEFPGQTHAFFWREILELRRMGSSPQILSTRRPPLSNTPHAWSAEAIRDTTYLGRPSVGQVARASLVLVVSLREGRLAAVWRELAAPPESFGERVALLLGGALLVTTARRGRWTHVHVHSCAGSARIAFVARLLGGPTYSLTLHGPLSDYGPHQDQKWAHAAFALIITRQLLTQAQATLGAALPESVSIAPMGVDLDSAVRAQPYRVWNGASEVRVFSCGRLNPSKGHDDLIRAVAILIAAGVPVRLTIAGEDDEGGTGYRSILERLIDELDIRSRVELLGAIDEERVREQLETAQVFALASHAEPLGVAIMEAMAMAVPVVVGDGGGVRELIDDGVTGVLVKPENPEAIAAAITRVLDDSRLAQTLGLEGQRRVRAKFGSAGTAVLLLARIKDEVAATRRRDNLAD
jgi:colanic acid/amylovoran biosynthesis glycosyltransferase